VLLARRFNTGWGDGKYNFPCGHVDAGESAVTALRREAKEEIGVTFHPRDLVFVGATHWLSSKQSVNLYFECRKWKGTPENREPDKCDALNWFDIARPPKDILLQTRAALKALRGKDRSFFVENL
jgi:8-oxo-dGTP pyrophosphatase MutT (NUDIX family)